MAAGLQLLYLFVVVKQELVFFFFVEAHCLLVNLQPLLDNP